MSVLYAQHGTIVLAEAIASSVQVLMMLRDVCASRRLMNVAMDFFSDDEVTCDKSNDVENWKQNR